VANQELAKIFYEIADRLASEDVEFKPYAYQRAAVTLETLEEDVKEIYERGGEKALKEIPGVGESIAQKIEEYLKTGKIKYYEKMKKKLPINLEELLKVEGMGPRKAKVLYQKLGVRDLKSLERAAKTHKIASLPGFGEKTEKNILEGIAFVKRSKGRFLLGYIMPTVEEIVGRLRELREIQNLSVAGSVKRMQETIGDVDILATSKDPKKVIEFFTAKMPGIVKIWGKGPTKASIRVKEGFDIDLRVVPEKSYGSALQYFTGSKEHNIKTRKIAITKGLKLNEYGVFRGSKMVAGKTEEDVYRAIGLPVMPPEIRTDEGEIEAAMAGKLPHLIGYSDIKGDLHCHSKWDGGLNSIEELAESAMQMGYEYIGISDHTKFLHIEHGLDEKKLSRQRKEIYELNARFKTQNKKFRILQGCEANIMPDGSIDIADDALAKLDYVIAGVHSQMKMPKEKMTERIIKAMKNPNVDIISHPTGRLIQKRDEYQIDFERILKAAKETGTILEIDSFPDRLDLKDANIRAAKEAGVKMVINTDTHAKDQMNFMKYGIAQARRGWAEKEDIINTRPVEGLLKFFK